MRLPALGNGASMKLMLTMSLLAASAGLVGGTVTKSSSLTENPSSFVAGTLVLSNTVATDLPCTSSAASLKCGSVIGANAAPGQVLSSSVTLQNVGVVPVNDLAFWISDCQSSDSPAASFHGVADLCPATQVTLHDDVHDVCYYPAVKAGSCSFAAGATIADLVSKHRRGAPLTLSPDHLGGGITYTVAMRVDTGVGNESQGRQATLDLVWQAGQG